jgi:hypothetical protein
MAKKILGLVGNKKKKKKFESEKNGALQHEN